MVSRLDRLFILLDTGSNESVRLAAAKQLGEVQKIQPNDLDYLLRRIKEYSTKAVWETRVAAGFATKCVLEQIDLWPQGNDVKGDDSKLKSRQEIADQLIEQNINVEQIFKEFNVEAILASCPRLLSTTIESQEDTDLIGPSNSRGSSRGRGRGRKDSSSSRPDRKKSSKEQLIRQRQQINKELGISMVDSLNLGVKSTDIVSNDDLLAEYNTDCSSSPTATKLENNQNCEAKIAVSLHVCLYQRIIEILAKNCCLSTAGSAKEGLNGTDMDSTATNRWPLSEITEEYVDNLFNPSWEIRHGAAIALREIVKLQGKSAGKRLELSSKSNDRLNQFWLIEMALKSICVLHLDKFGDFLFDQVVAPVRENAAQLLGCCVAWMTEENTHFIVNILITMLSSPTWETRHGGILGLKYTLNVLNRDTIKGILKLCFDPIFKCLGDTNDDVSAEAAASLVPVKDLMIETIPDKAPTLIKFLWDHLADLDELTTSTSNIVLLLASLITSSTAQLEPNELTKSIPKLWPLLSHSSTSVRISVLKALITLITPQKTACLHWMPEELLTTALRLVFQRSILENMEEVRPYIEEVWKQLIKIDKDILLGQEERLNLLKSTSKYLNYWLCLTMQPSNTQIDRGYTLWLNIRPDGTESDEKPDGEIYIGSCTFNAETIDQQKIQVTKCRLLGTRLIGSLYANLVCDTGESQYANEALLYISDMFIHYLRTKSANQRMFSGWAIESWASFQSILLDYNFEKLKTVIPEHLASQLQSALKDTTLCYDELATAFTRLQQEARDFVASLVALNLNTTPPVPTDRRAIYNLNQIQTMCDIDLEAEFVRLTTKKGAKKSSQTREFETSDTFISLSNKKLNITKLLQSIRVSQKSLSTAVLSSLACAHISWRLIPERLSLLTYPLLDSIEIEEEQAIQDKSTNYLITLLDMLCYDTNKHGAIINDVVGRLIDTLCSRYNNIRQMDQGADVKMTNEVDSDLKNQSDRCRIVLLDNLQRKAEQKGLMRRQSSINSTSSMKRSHSLTSTSSEFDAKDTTSNNLSINQANETKIVGVSSALNKIASHFGDELPKKLPVFWASITVEIRSQIDAYCKERSGNQLDMKLLHNLTLLQVIGQSLSPSIRTELMSLFPELIRILISPNPMIRHQSCQCIGLISKLMLEETLDLINQNIIPMLERDDDVIARCGAVEAIALIVEHLNLDLVPKINMFVIHVLRRMSDQNDQVRLMATHCFAKLLCLMPLNTEHDKVSSESKVTLPTGNVSTQNGELSFIDQLLDPKKLNSYRIPFEMSAELRSYQQEGLNWLAFLNRFNLHGILCDEMGLGKTLMTISIVASDHYNQEIDPLVSKRLPPSLIVCPSTLTEHWLYEIRKFIPSKTRSILNPVIYGGAQTDRTTIRQTILQDGQKSETDSKKQRINLVVTSYDILRNDIEFFKLINWNYCVLDEGHIIKNSKTKLSKAVRYLNASHRLILSGTPIQNNVTELWSLFDFLMPGFLGSERQFNNRYAKPILQSREPKCSPRELEAGALAMESLHRQVLPFILRRLKEDVLDDLPPKIIQDYYCELSPLQLQLYEDFTKSRLCKDVTKKALKRLDEDEKDSKDDVKSNSKSHVFQALQYLKNVCNHPKLVLTEKHFKFREIKKSLDNDRVSLDDICHSSKLKALKQLLIDCGIGIANQIGEEQQVPTNSVQQQQQQSLELVTPMIVNQHRALVFCQLRSMVNIIENDLLKKHLPSITYLKLDGSIPPSQRHSIVSRFNNDPSIDILLLTTQIGGLGLNLTGADTVIFVEHDWNPTKDLQAMDRAHRIGQKKVVNVYRLITKDTLEEKIMGLQKFKTMVSNTVINQDNTGLGTMNVEQLLDLFEDTAASSTSMIGDDNNVVKMRDSTSSGGDRKTSFEELLPELWDQQQYETEYDLSSFVSSLKH